MICIHAKTKMKLVSFAIDYGRTHRQWFEYVLCCAECGIIINKDKE